MHVSYAQFSPINAESVRGSTGESANFRRDQIKIVFMYVSFFQFIKTKAKCRHYSLSGGDIKETASKDL